MSLFRTCRLLAVVLLASACFGQVIPGRYLLELDARVADKSEAGLARARAAQAPMRARLATAGVEVRESLVATTNALIVDIPSGQEDTVAALAGVKGLTPIVMAKAWLDAAPDLLGATAAWRNFHGAERAGLGIKIGILDTGIDFTHAAFQDPSLTPPAGFPRADRAVNLAYTNNKVIVARSYATMYDASATDLRPIDLNGHGTWVAASAAAVIQQTPRGPASGIAPKAFLGNYRITPPGSGGSASGEVILKAFDDAVADGMDVINISFGSPLAVRPEADAFTGMVNAATAQGVVVVAAAGNLGPEPDTVSNLAQPPQVIAVGGTRHGRVIAAELAVADGQKIAAKLGTATPDTTAAITAPLRDVAAVDSSGLACNALPAGSMAGTIALILRGNCFFSDKLTNVSAAGAIAAVIYTATAADEPFSFEQGGVATPGVMVSNADGLYVKSLIAAGATAATLTFEQKPTFVNYRKLWSGSSIGPGASFAIKPDVAAIAQDVYLPKLGGGYQTVTGTSFASPLVAGAVAFLKSARPGLTAAQYRSLIVNSAQWMDERLQQRGNGALNVDQAANSTIVADPTSVTFGISGVNVDITRQLTITNLSTSQKTYTLSVFPLTAGPAPTLSAASLTLAPGISGTVNARFAASGLPGGERNGLFIIGATSSGEQIFVPYWHGVPTNVVSKISLLQSDAGELVLPGASSVIFFRLLDDAGMPAVGPVPEVTAPTGGRVTTVASLNATFPGVWGAQVRLPTTKGTAPYVIHADGAPDVTVALVAGP